jgi:hypothetical protein
MEHSTFRRASISILIAGLAAVAMSGCMAIKLALGIRTRLDNKPVTSISASIDAPGGVGPGQSTRLIIVADTSDEKQLVTVGPGKGKVLFSSFTYTGTLASIGKRGVVTLVDDPRLIEGHTPRVHIVTIGHPGATADLDIPVRYDVPFTADFTGAVGFTGSAGSAGSDGASGSEGSTDPKNPCAGGDGNNGGDGGDGGEGGDGGPGQDVHVWLTVRPGDHPLLEARVLSSSQEKFYLVDPAGGSLNVNASGGAGGAGGAGGSGGAGGQGGNGSPKGRDGLNGNPGRQGTPGKGGAPGSIVVSIDPKAEAYLKNLPLNVRSGDGGDGPAPKITIEPVPLLW